MATKTPSKQQVRVYKWAEAEEGHAILEAGAGAGKTTTVVDMMHVIPSNKKAVFLAFNKAIALELKDRVPANAEAMTFHSLGFRAWAKYVGQRRLWVPNGTSKSWRIMFEMSKNGALEKNEVPTYGSFVNKLVSLMKNHGALPDDTEIMTELIDHYNVDLGTRNGDIERGIAISQMVLRGSIEQANKVIDFDDMIYMPYIKNVRFPKFDWIVVDELQDTNKVQLYILQRLVESGARFCGVGDKRQAIYGFRGANSDAMQEIKSTFDCVSLPLTVSYRCAKSIIKHAQSIVPEIDAWDKSPNGEVIVESPKNYKADIFTKTDAVVCRMNGPLVKMFYWLLKQGRGSRIRGRDIGTGLVGLIKKMDAANLDDLETKLADYFEQESARLAKKGQHDAVANLKDKQECLSYIAANSKNVEDMISQIETMFADYSTGMLTLSSIHRAKGLEWPTVYILDAGLMPCKYATKEWELEQESNLHYVAITRAKEKLVYLESAYRADLQ